MNELTIAPIDGEARILDTDLAQRLGFERPRDIRKLIKRHEDALGQLGRCATVAHRPERGGKEETRCYLNRKQAIFITAKSETAAATEITIEIIERFDEYERGQHPAMPDLNDPKLLQSLLLQNLEKRIEAEQRADKAEKLAAAAQETVSAFDRIYTADGSLSVTEAAKALQMRPSDLFDWISRNGWIYKRTGSANWLGYQVRATAGDLEHKVTTVLRPDGSEKVTEQVRITAQGLAKLAKLNPPALRVA